ncbi:hypothetical protein [Nitrospina gracilis]|uniref:hypothetical protein n=1 Tax=Nitrospina gracilis TaxID=35801 RepID=UPI001F1D5482|nr:hypothetical protein [Nitrospina gracilis]MCF8719418.1 hypothetical protein [Nitrospina gracilis Nb-211]
MKITIHKDMMEKRVGQKLEVRTNYMGLMLIFQGSGAECAPRNRLQPLLNEAINAEFLALKRKPQGSRDCIHGR